MQKIMNKTKGQIEAEISNAITRYEREQLGRGPDETRTFILQNMLIIRLKGILTPAERNLAQTADGDKLIKEVRLKIIENSRALLETMICEITGCKLVKLFTDLNPALGERIFVFVLDKDLQNELGEI